MSVQGFEGVCDADKDAYLSNYGAHRVGISPREVVEYYDQWCDVQEGYEKALNPDLYRGPRIAAQKLAALFQDRRHVSVLDVAAGTGLVGERLREAGFSKIDALDPSRRMLDKAKEKNIYAEYFCSFIQDQCSIEESCYDAVVTSGGMGEGHIPCAGVVEMHRITRPGGYVVIVMREEYLSYVDEYKGKLDELIGAMRRDGRWTECSREVVERYSFGKNGVVFTLQKA